MTLDSPIQQRQIHDHARACLICRVSPFFVELVLFFTRYPGVVISVIAKQQTSAETNNTGKRNIM